MSKRAQRMGAQNSKSKGPVSLNLVSLMDIFTILVFFLMFNQSDVEVLQHEDINLPESYSEKVPVDTLIIQVSSEDIIVKGRPIAKVDDVISSGSRTVKSLKEELKYHSKKKVELSDDEKKNGLAVTIMGDQEVPYKLLKKIMLTCSGMNYTQISLAVTRKSRPDAGIMLAQGGAR